MVFITVAVYSAMDLRLALRFTGLHGTLFAWRKPIETTSAIRPENIGSLTDFSRNTKAHLKRLRRTGRHELLTVNGKAAVIIQNASTFQRVIESLKKFERESTPNQEVKKGTRS
jgi:hypothetical protein